MKKVFLIVILLFHIVICTSQNRRVADSLIKNLENNSLTKKEEAQKLILLSYYHPNVDSADFLAKKSYKIALEIGDSILQAEALEEISNKENLVGNNSKSLQATLKALKIYESLGMREKQAASYNQLAANYMGEKNYTEAIKYLKKAIDIYSISDKYGNGILTILNLGEMYRLASYLDSAKVNLKQAQKINKQRNKVVESYAKGNLGMVYNTQDSLSMAKTHLQDAISILGELGDSYATSVYLAELGAVYQKEGGIKTAEENYLQALNMAQEAGLKEQIRDFSKKLTQFYESQNNYNKALTYQKLFQVYQDSLVNKANIQEVERLKAGYEIDKRESEIGLLSKVNTNQKYLVWALGAGVVATLVFLYLLYKGNRKVKKANTTLSVQKEIITQREQEKTLLLRELNHRVKNNLQMISSLLNLQSHELKGHPAKAALEAGKDRVEALSLVHRKLYQEGAETRISLKEYLEELVLGLFYGYNAGFKPKFELPDTSISIDTAVPLALMVNEIIVNALKYAYKGVDKPSLSLKVNHADAMLHIHIKDNGKGFTIKESKKKNSFGLKLINSLIAQLEGSIEKKGSHGTHWVIQLPYKVKLVSEKQFQKPAKEKQLFQRFHRRKRKKVKSV
ncbi:histidine kinase dimerization/phosphoacceptor domain -containing protein [uncultured Croceitalea sp.]|uniref:tetratricopeptide repeat-containing sensor histidine kinase n=1 Tax=uncultured Croceitalea sp. TaxID=1798908 RepID=UPI0033058725